MMLLHVLLSLLLVSALSAQMTNGEEEDLDLFEEEFLEEGETNPTLTMQGLTDFLQTTDRQGEDFSAEDYVTNGGVDIDDDVVSALDEMEGEAAREPTVTGELQAEQTRRGPDRLDLFLRLLSRSRFVRFYILLVFRGKGDYKRALRDFYKFKPSHAKCWKGYCRGFLGDNQIILKASTKYRRYTTLIIVTRIFVFRFQYYDYYKNPYSTRTHRH